VIATSPVDPTIDAVIAAFIVAAALASRARNRRYVAPRSHALR
jgi:hypothetical protein